MTLLSAIWDFDKADNRLGSFILFQEELLQICHLCGATSVDLNFTATPSGCNKIFWKSLAEFNPLIQSIQFDDEKSEAKSPLNNNSLTWPNDTIKSEFSYNGSTLQIQKLWKNTGIMFELLAPNDVMKKARNLLSRFVYSDIPITVHLKSNASDYQSNADQQSWLTFFSLCLEDRLPVKYILIGNESLNSEFENLKNVVVTKLFDSDLRLDLSLVLLSAGFMGMSSGPCNVAIMSKKPYLIWKHPEHHETEIKKELFAPDGFIFAQNSQKFYREYDTVDHILNRFRPWYSKYLLKEN